MNQRDDLSYELISAYVDGELTPDECARVEQLVASSDEYRQVLGELRAVVDGMRRLPEYHLDRAFPARVVAAARELGATLDDRVVPATRPTPARASANVWHWPAAVSLLTAVAAVAIAAVFLWDVGQDPPASNTRQLISQATPRAGEEAADRTPGTGPSPAVTRDTPAETRTHVAVPDSTARTTDTAPEPIPAPSDVAPSPPAPTPGTVGPSIAASEPATPDAQHAAQPDPDAQVVMEPLPSPAPPPRTREGRLPDDVLVDVPFSGAQQMLLVIDVALTQQGLAKGAFEQVLGAQGIPVAGAVSVDTRLEQSLMASRFFEPVQAPAGNVAAADTRLSLVFVRTRAGQVDDLWRAMQADQGHFSSVTLDMAIVADDQSLFQELRRAVDLQVADAPAVADAERRARRAAAHRLVLSPSWRGTPVAKLAGVNGLAGLVPDWMLGKDAIKDQPIAGVPGQPTPTVPLPPGGRLGENVDAELLVVLHVGRLPRSAEPPGTR